MDQASLSSLANRLAARLKKSGALLQPIRCVEIGARKTGANLDQEPFYALNDGLILAFEADAVEAERLSAALRENSQIHVSHAAISGREGVADLFLTRSPKCSSLYRPNESLIARYPDLTIASLERTTTVPVTTLAKALSSAGWQEAHLLKMDIQGAELDVIEGAGAAVDCVIALVAEVSFQPIYEGQPLAEDVLSVLRQKGFELYRLLTQAGLARRSARRDQMQLLWGDALFFRPPEELASVDAARLAVLATLYGALDVAECALERVNGQHHAWFIGEVRQPYRDMIMDTRANARRVGRGLVRRLLALAG